MTEAKAENILESFKEGLKPLKLDSLLQVSMDGPNVNWKFLRLLQEDEDVNIVDLGSCGLHVVHGAFQSGHKAAGWTVNDFLRGIYWLFKDSPARRAAFIKLTGQYEFPIKFCAIRWVESVSAAYKALSIFDEIEKYVNDETTKLPNTTTVRNVKKALEDKLLKCKIAFFATIASPLEVFLRKFQSPSPLVPFLYKSLDVILRSLLEKFVKKSVLEKETNSLLKLDLQNQNLFLPLNDIDLGFRTNKYFKECKASEKEKTDFLKDCRYFLINVVKKICERSPLKYKVVKTAMSLDPDNLVKEKKLAKEMFNSLLQLFADKNMISLELGESCSIQFNELLNDPYLDDVYTDYKKSTVDLDRFYTNLLSRKTEYCDLFNFIKRMLILSHGNAVVESGFSVNKNMLVENLTERSLIARRQVYDYICKQGGAINIDISKELKTHCRRAHFKYTSALEERSKADEKEKEQREAKKRIASEINYLEKKKAKISTLAEYERSDIDRKLLELRKKI